jgi:hypothetical protein
MIRQAHLVGSVGLSNAETVFTTVSKILGPCCRRIPDGETGDRGYWIRWQRDTFATHLSFEEATTTRSLSGFKDSLPRTFFKVRKGVNLTKLKLGELGYARAAEASYNTFEQLVNEGKVAADVRFQVSLPTPAALVCGFIIESDRKKVERAVERALLSEIDLIQSSIPPDRLCIQWDVCYEIVAAEGKMQLPYADAVGGSIKRIGRLCGKVKPRTELGIHLCYGDPGHKHIVEPRDLGVCVTFANGICQASPRPIAFIHLPVPRNQAGESYFGPLKQLALPSCTRLVLGLIHYTDGVEGSRRRIGTAERYLERFDIATECGFGRRDPATIPELLRIHKELCCD